MNFLLFIVAWGGKIILFPIFILWAIARAFKQLPKYWYGSAYRIDVLGNWLGQYALNDTLQKHGYKFGKNETISYAIAINRKFGTLTKFGKLVARILELLDPGHLEKSINNR